MPHGIVRRHSPVSLPMSINLFAGARRIAVLVAIGIAGVTGFFIATERPYITRTVFVDEQHPYAPPVLGDAACPFAQGWVTLTQTVRTPKGFDVSVDICATSYVRAEGGRAFVNDRFFPASELSLMDRYGSEQLWSKRKDYFVAGLATLAVWFAMTWATGWIARGFLGIPRGMDRRPDTTVEPG